MRNIKGKGIDDIVPLPAYVEATAVTYFRRFFLRNSILEYSPSAIAQTAIYVAAKVEEHVEFDARQIATMLDGDAKGIRSMEMDMLRGLDFHLAVRHPYKPMKALCSLLVGTTPKGTEKPLTGKQCEALEAEAANIIRRSLVTDAIFCFSPAQIAVACARIACGNSTHGLGIPPEHIDGTVRQKCLDSSSFDKLYLAILACEEIIRKPLRPSLLCQEKIDELLHHFTSAKDASRTFT